MKIKSITYTLVFGAATGLVYALALWGYEMILLFRAHVAYAWLPGTIGMAACAGLCASAALLTHLFKKALLGVVFWVLAAVAIAQLLIKIPIQIVPHLMILIEPGLQARLPVYPFIDTFKYWAGMDAIWLSIFFGILGLLQITLVDGAVPAYRPAGRLAPYFVMLPIMIIVSVMSGNLVNEQMRDPLISTNELVQFAVDHQNVTVDPEEERQMHLAALRTVSGLITRPRRLFLGAYDKSFGQVDVLIDFDGEWADCTTVYGQTVFCKAATP